MFFYQLVCFHCEYLKTQKYEKGVWTIAPKGNFPLVRFRVWLTVRVRIRVGGGAFSLGEGKLSQNLQKCCSLKKKNTFEKKQFWKVGVVTLKLYLAWQRSMLCQIKNDFYWLSTFIANIWVLKNLKMLFFKQNNAFNQTQF